MTRHSGAPAKSGNDLPAHPPGRNQAGLGAHRRPTAEQATCEEVVLEESALWEPVSFIIDPWSRLTRLYEIPGVPLDSNPVEQALIIPVR